MTIVPSLNILWLPIFPSVKGAFVYSSRNTFKLRELHIVVTSHPSELLQEISHWLIW